jgi:hypothetical protein
MVIASAIYLVAVTLAPEPLDPRYQALGGPFDFRGLSGVLLVANQVGLAVTLLSVAVAGGSMVARFRRARGIERQQLLWVAIAAAVAVLVSVVVLAGLAMGLPGGPALLSWGAGVCLAVLPLGIGAAVLRYRLYDLDHVISRTLVYGLLTVLLAAGYVGVVLGFGQLVGRKSPLTVALATLTIAALFQPARRRIQAAVDRRFNRRRYDAARTIQQFGGRLRQHIELDTLTAELMAVVDQTMQPTQASLWLRFPSQRLHAPRLEGDAPSLAQTQAESTLMTDNGD